MRVGRESWMIQFKVLGRFMLKDLGRRILLLGGGLPLSMARKRASELQSRLLNGRFKRDSIGELYRGY